MHIFYTPNIKDLFLDKEESYHCIRVLRLKKNDTITLVDGKGGYAEAIIVNASEKKIGYKIVNAVENYSPLPYKLHIAIAPTKNINRFEWFVEKATEIGISEITPLISNNSERKVIKKERMEKVVISSAKQSQKAFFPILNDITNLKDFLINQKNNPSSKLIAYCGEEEKYMITDCQTSDDVIVCIGPEGDFDEQEIRLAKKSGFIILTLGQNRLRTETAAIYVCSAINLLQNLKKIN